MAKTKGPPIEAQAVAALILGQLGHKLVAKLPGARAISGTTDGLRCSGPLRCLCSGIGHLPLAHSLGLHHWDCAGDRDYPSTACLSCCYGDSVGLLLLAGLSGSGEVV